MDNPALCDRVELMIVKLDALLREQETLQQQFLDVQKVLLYQLEQVNRRFVSVEWMLGLRVSDGK